MSDTTDKDLLDVEDVARRLGIGRTMVYELMSAGKIRFIKIGRRTLIPSSEIPAFIARKLQGGDDA